MSQHPTCLACGAPCFVHYCYNCGTSDPCAAESQKTAARLARICAAQEEELVKLRRAYRTLRAALLEASSKAEALMPLPKDT